MGLNLLNLASQDSFNISEGIILGIHVYEVLLRIHALFSYPNHIQNSVQSRLVEFQEENNSLRSKIRSLEVASQGVTEQEKLIGRVSTLWSFKSFE